MAPPSPQNPWHGFGTAWNAVLSMFSATLFYGLLGWYADKWLHTGHLLFALGVVGGNMLGLYLLYVKSKRADDLAAAARQASRAAR